MRKEIMTMQILKSNKLSVVLTALALILAFGVPTSTAQEKIKDKSKVYGVFTKFEQMKPDDTEGHTMSFYEAKGAGTGSSGEFTVFMQGMSDLIKGNGSHHGYSKITDKDGHFYFNKWQGKVAATKSPEGKTVLRWEGTWSIIRGTGKWENAQGEGTYKGWFIGKGIYTYISEGEYSIKK
jgi:hypothetical protein